MLDPKNLLAFTIFGLAAAFTLGLAWLRLRRLPFTMPQNLLFSFNYAVARLLWRTQVIGQPQLAPGQGAVLVCNHRSSLDPSFVELAVPKVVHWMVAREYCQNRIMGRFLRICEVIPTGRAGIDTAATKMAIRLVQQGGLVGIFPEGSINRGDDFMLPVRAGAAMIALKAGVPILPCYVEGSPYDGTPLGCLLMPAKVKLYVGKPIDVSPNLGRGSEREAADELTRQAVKAIAELAGRSDYEPVLAGRRGARD